MLGEPGPMVQVIVWTEIDPASSAVIGPFASVVATLALETFFVLSGTSAIATSTWLAHAIFTRSPTANGPSLGESAVTAHVRWRPLPCRPTVIELEVSLEIAPVAEAGA